MNRFGTRDVFWILALLILTTVSLAAQEMGPKNGTLVISGGAEKPGIILERFIALAGGPDAPIIVIPTSGNAEEYDQNYSGLKRFRDAGARNLFVLHTRNRAVANSDEFVKPLQIAKGVWFEGGSHWRHADAYLDTKARNRQFDLIGVIQSHPEMLGIGIDEDTAIVVQGDKFEVIGRSFALIYDNQTQLDHDGAETFRTVGGLFYFLRPGDTYNMKTREPFRPGTGSSGGGTFQRVTKKNWPGK